MGNCEVSTGVSLSLSPVKSDGPAPSAGMPVRRTSRVLGWPIPTWSGRPQSDVSVGYRCRHDRMPAARGWYRSPRTRDVLGSRVDELNAVGLGMGARSVGAGTNNRADLDCSEWLGCQPWRICSRLLPGRRPSRDLVDRLDLPRAQLENPQKVDRTNRKGRFDLDSRPSPAPRFSGTYCDARLALATSAEAGRPGARCARSSPNRPSTSDPARAGSDTNQRERPAAEAAEDRERSAA